MWKTPYLSRKKWTSETFFGFVVAFVLGSFLLLRQNLGKKSNQTCTNFSRDKSGQISKQIPFLLLAIRVYAHVHPCFNIWCVWNAQRRTIMMLTKIICLVKPISQLSILTQASCVHCFYVGWRYLWLCQLPILRNGIPTQNKYKVKVNSTLQDYLDKPWRNEIK